MGCDNLSNKRYINSTVKGLPPQTTLKVMDKHRIRKIDSTTFVSEVQKRTWYGRKYWTPYISPMGMGYTPWLFVSYDNALNQTLLKIKWSIIENSKRSAN